MRVTAANSTNLAPVPSADPSAKRVLVYRVGSLGDTLVAFPALDVVARAFPHAERRLLTNFPVARKAPPSAAVLNSTGLVHSYERYEVGLRSPWKLLRLVWRIRRWKPDAMVYLSPPRGVGVAMRDMLFFRVAGIHTFFGVPSTETLQHCLPVGDGLVEREGERLSRTVQSLGTADPESYRLTFTEDELRSAAELLAPLRGRPFFAISLGTKVQANDWGIDNWTELVRRLSKEYGDFSLVLLGAQDDIPSSEAVLNGWRAATNAPCMNLCGKISPRESGAVLSTASLYLGHDSGPLHLAAASGARCVGIFSGRNPAGKWWPFGEEHTVIQHHVSCSPCGLEVCIAEGKRCLFSISVEEVMQAVNKRFEAKVP